MKKTLFDPLTASEIITRFQSLTPASTPRWGTMTVAEMLLHCTRANTFIVDDRTPWKPQSPKQRLRKFAALHLISRFPRNRIGPRRLVTTGLADRTTFEPLRMTCIESIIRLSNHTQPITSAHAAMGCLTTAEWGVIAWMHLDHHLRQFGT